MKYLNLDGVSKLWEKSVAKFALKSHTHSVATTSDDGFMSKSDKLKLNRLENTDYPLPINKGGTGAGTLSEATLNLMSRGTVTDANEVKDIGYYMTDTSTTNLPVVESYGILTVVRVGYAEGSSWIIQYWSSTVDNKTQVYMRKNINNQGFKDWYQIQGTDEPVPIANGGTGATTAAQALTNLGAFPSSGGTLTGAIFVNGYVKGARFCVNGTNDYPTYEFKAKSQTDYGCMMQTGSTNMFGIYEYPKEFDGQSTRYYEGYVLPEPSTGLTQNQVYRILTTKTVIYSASQPSNPSTGTIWLKPV